MIWKHKLYHFTVTNTHEFYSSSNTSQNVKIQLLTTSISVDSVSVIYTYFRDDSVGCGDILPGWVEDGWSGSHISVHSVHVISISEMIVLVVAIFYLAGWRMGGVEAISLSILVGSSVDYCVHLVEGYLLAGKAVPTSVKQVRQEVIWLYGLLKVLPEESHF